MRSHDYSHRLLLAGGLAARHNYWRVTLLTLVIGTLTGTCIPLLLSRFKGDPAVASGPLITTLNDILSLFIYFGIATRFLDALM